MNRSGQRYISGKQVCCLGFGGRISDLGANSVGVNTHDKQEPKHHVQCDFSCLWWKNMLFGCIRIIPSRHFLVLSKVLSAVIKGLDQAYFPAVTCSQCSFPSRSVYGQSCFEWQVGRRAQPRALTLPTANWQIWSRLVPFFFLKKIANESFSVYLGLLQSIQNAYPVYGQCCVKALLVHHCN